MDHTMDIKKFLDIERKYRLNEISAAGVQYWNYARFPIWNYRICSSQLELGEPHKKKKYTPAQKLRILAGLACQCLQKRRVPVRQADVLFLCHERRVKNGRHYECAYTERLAGHYPDSVTLEKPYEYRHLKPVKNRHMMYADYIAVKGNLYYQAHKLLKTKKYRKLLRMVEAQMEKPLAELRESYDFGTKDSEIYGLLVEQILLYQKEYGEYRKLLGRIRPKVIVEVVHYCMQNMIINEIAAGKGIPTIELQHGTIYAEHAAYQYAGDAKIRQFPGRLLLFSDFWKRGLHVPLPEDCVIAAGYPLFEEKMAAYGARGRNRGSAKKTVLFISQGTIGQRLGRLACELSQLLPAEKYRILYRLHPCECQTWEEDYAYFDTRRIEVSGQGTGSIYEAFAQSDMQIGVYSTAVYEGIGFGLDTLLLKAGHYGAMQPLVDAGYARYISSAREAAEYIEGNQWGKNKENSFWKRDALRNIIHEIDQALEGKGL